MEVQKGHVRTQYFDTDIVTHSGKFSKCLKSEDNTVTVDGLVSFIKEGERFGNCLLPAISQAMLSSLFHKTDHSSNNIQDENKSRKIMLTLQQQVLVIKKDSANIVRDVSVISPTVELVQQDEESNSRVVVDRNQSLKLLTCSVHQAVLNMIMERIVGHREKNPRFFRKSLKHEKNLVKDFERASNIFSLHKFGNLADKGFWTHTFHSFLLAKNYYNQITNATVTSIHSPEEERQLFGRNRRIREYKLKMKNWRWLKGRFATAHNLFSIKRNTKTIKVRCPFHKNGQEKKFSMVIEKVFENEFKNIGNIDDEQYMNSIRRRLPYANSHLKTKLLSRILVEDPHQQDQLDWWKQLASDEDNLPDHKIVEFFEEEANVCGCVKWPEKLQLADTEYGNVYTSSLFSNLPCLSYGYQYTCRPCHNFNVPISGSVATRIVQNNTDVLLVNSKRK